MPFTNEELLQIRRELHEIPELGMAEFETQAYLLDKIQQMTQTLKRVKIRTWKTAVLVKITGFDSDKIIGWRADMDGLPVNEETSLEFSSKHEGRMHACGHDIHMTVALGLLKIATETPSKNDRLFLFQPAEENLSGAKLLYEANVFADWLPDEFYALHVHPELPVGQLATNNHTLFAGTCEVSIKFTGRGGHAAFPQNSNDMVVAVSHFVTQVQTIISRNVGPMENAVVTFGKMRAGMTNNVIAKEAEVHGTIRTLTKEMNELTQKRITQIAEGIAQSFDCQAEIILKQGGYLPVINNKNLADQLISFLKEKPTVNFSEISPLMTGEDFGYLLDKVPGVMLWLGVQSDYPLHHEKMSPKEAAIMPAVEALSAWLATR